MRPGCPLSVQPSCQQAHDLADLHRHAAYRTDEPRQRARHWAAVPATDVGRTIPVAVPPAGGEPAGQRGVGPEERVFCKTVGTAYDGSNPSPATTCEDAPRPADTTVRRTRGTRGPLSHEFRALPLRDKSHGRMTDQLPAGPAARGRPRAVSIPAGDPFRMAGLPILGAARGGSRTRMVAWARRAEPVCRVSCQRRGAAGRRGPVCSRPGPAAASPPVRHPGGRGWRAGAVAGRRRIGPVRLMAGSTAGPRPAAAAARADGRHVRRSEACLPSANTAGHRRSDVISEDRRLCRLLCAATWPAVA